VTVPSELRTTVPLDGLETAEITSVSPSRSVSLGVTRSLMPRTIAVSSLVETRVVDRDWSVVDRADVDRHRSGVGAAIAVAAWIIEGGSAVEVGGRVKVTVPSGLRTTVPLVGLETAEMTSVSPSRSVSFGETISLMLRTRVESSVGGRPSHLSRLERR